MGPRSRVCKQLCCLTCFCTLGSALTGSVGPDQTRAEATGHRVCPPPPSAHTDTYQQTNPPTQTHLQCVGLLSCLNEPRTRMQTCGQSHSSSSSSPSSSQRGTPPRHAELPENKKHIKSQQSELDSSVEEGTRGLMCSVFTDLMTSRRSNENFPPTVTERPQPGWNSRSKPKDEDLRTVQTRAPMDQEP